MPMCPEESDSKNGHLCAEEFDSKYRNLLPRLPRISISEFQVGVPGTSYLMGEDDSRSPRNDLEDGVYFKPEPDSPISEKFSVFDYSDEDDDDDDDDAESYVRCFNCEFEIKFPVVPSLVETFHSDLVCPMCDERVGDNTMRKLLSTAQRTWNTEKSRVWVENAEKFCLELAARESIDEPASDSLLSPFGRNMSTEGPIKNALDISNAKSLWTDDGPDAGDEKHPEDREEKDLRASFVQQLVLSTMM